MSLTFFSVEIDPEHENGPGLQMCQAYDHATVLASNEDVNCALPPVEVLQMRIGEDITLAQALCIVHLNAFKLGLRDGQVLYDADSLQ